MKKVSKVKSVNNAFNSWEKDGTIYYPHRYEMEDGTVIDANHKQLNPFKVGDEVEYEVKSEDKQGNPKGSVGKPSQNNYSGGGSNSKTYVDNSDAILYQTCLKAVSENFVSRGNTVIEFKIEDVDRMATLALHLAKVSKANIELLKQG